MDPLMLMLILLVVLWATGAFIMPFGGSAIHLLLLIIPVVLLVRLLQNKSV